MQLKIAQSTPTAGSIAEFVQSNYDLGEVVGSEFLRRSFNQVYRLEFADGRRVVARLSAERPRGGPNLHFEAEVLDHWARRGCAVSRCLRASNGDVSISVPLPEGARALMLFEFLDGEDTGDSDEDIQAFARGLAALHVAGDGYRGTASLYTLDLDYLLWRPLEGLLQAPTMATELRSQYEALAARLCDRIEGLGPLSRVMCHGDAHGYNNFVVPGEHGVRKATFFDFDEAGPGYLAYELAVWGRECSLSHTQRFGYMDHTALCDQIHIGWDGAQKKGALNAESALTRVTCRSSLGRESSLRFHRRLPELPRPIQARRPS